MILDHLARRGFSATSDEVKLYKQSVLSSSSDLIDLSNYSNCSFGQWSPEMSITTAMEKNVPWNRSNRFCYTKEHWTSEKATGR